MSSKSASKAPDDRDSDVEMGGMGSPTLSSHAHISTAPTPYESSFGSPGNDEPDDNVDGDPYDLATNGGNIDLNEQNEQIEQGTGLVTNTPDPGATPSTDNPLRRSGRDRRPPPGFNDLASDGRPPGSGIPAPSRNRREGGLQRIIRDRRRQSHINALITDFPPQPYAGRGGRPSPPTNVRGRLQHQARAAANAVAARGGGGGGQFAQTPGHPQQILVNGIADLAGVVSQADATNTRGRGARGRAGRGRGRAGRAAAPPVNLSGHTVQQQMADEAAAAQEDSSQDSLNRGRGGRGTAGRGRSRAGRGAAIPAQAQETQVEQPTDETAATQGQAPQPRSTLNRGRAARAAAVQERETTAPQAEQPLGETAATEGDGDVPQAEPASNRGRGGRGRAGRGRAARAAAVQGQETTAPQPQQPLDETAATEGGGDVYQAEPTSTRGRGGRAAAVKGQDEDNSTQGQQILGEPAVVGTMVSQTEPTSTRGRGGRGRGGRGRTGRAAAVQGQGTGTQHHAELEDYLSTERQPTGEAAEVDANVSQAGAVENQGMILLYDKMIVTNLVEQISLLRALPDDTEEDVFSQAFVDRRGGVDGAEKHVEDFVDWAQIGHSAPISKEAGPTREAFAGEANTSHAQALQRAHGYPNYPSMVVTNLGEQIGQLRKMPDDTDQDVFSREFADRYDGNYAVIDTEHSNPPVNSGGTTVVTADALPLHGHTSKYSSVNNNRHAGFALPQSSKPPAGNHTLRLPSTSAASRAAIRHDTPQAELANSGKTLDHSRSHGLHDPGPSSTQALALASWTDIVQRATQVPHRQDSDPFLAGGAGVQVAQNLIDGLQALRVQNPKARIGPLLRLTRTALEEAVLKYAIAEQQKELVGDDEEHTVAEDYDDEDEQEDISENEVPDEHEAEDDSIRNDGRPKRAIRAPSRYRDEVEGVQDTRNLLDHSHTALSHPAYKQVSIVPVHSTTTLPSRQSTPESDLPSLTITIRNPRTHIPPLDRIHIPENDPLVIVRFFEQHDRFSPVHLSHFLEAPAIIWEFCRVPALPFQVRDPVTAHMSTELIEMETPLRRTTSSGDTDDPSDYTIITRPLGRLDIERKLRYYDYHLRFPSSSSPAYVVPRHFFIWLHWSVARSHASYTGFHDPEHLPLENDEEVRRQFGEFLECYVFFAAKFELVDFANYLLDQMRWCSLSLRGTNELPFPVDTMPRIWNRIVFPETDKRDGRNAFRSFVAFAVIEAYWPTDVPEAVKSNVMDGSVGMEREWCEAEGLGNAFVKEVMAGGGKISTNMVVQRAREWWGLDADRAPRIMKVARRKQELVREEFEVDSERVMEVIEVDSGVEDEDEKDDDGENYTENDFGAANYTENEHYGDNNPELAENDTDSDKEHSDDEGSETVGQQTVSASAMDISW